jgi:adenylate cyclase, class 2
MEIELRAFIDNFEEIEATLQKIGAKLTGTIEILDLWFCDKNSTKIEQVRQHEAGSYGIRIRRSRKDGQEIIEMNSKVLETKGDHNVFHEYETEIKDLEQGRKILESIGFKVFCTVDKKRKIFEFENCTVNLENIKGFRPAVELEIIADKNIEDHKTYLKELLDKLGIKEEDKIEKSITYLYMEEFCFKE